MKFTNWFKKKEKEEIEAERVRRLQEEAGWYPAIQKGKPLLEIILKLLLEKIGSYRDGLENPLLAKDLHRISVIQGMIKDRRNVIEELGELEARSLAAMESLKRIKDRQKAGE